eukprot:jgi/Psemu1/306176/fgenesh1_kg.239_\
MGVLSVTVVKATNLADKDLMGMTDAYIKLEIEQDNFIRDVDYGFQKTSTKSGDLNPVWDETFSFTLPTLDNMVLTCKVMDADVGSSDDKAGKCRIKLEEEELSSSPKRIEKCVDFNLLSANGELTLDIAWEEE